MHKPLITVIIVPVHNLAPCLEMTLKALEAQHFETSEFECIVVDDDSDDDVAAFLSRHEWRINIKVLPRGSRTTRSIARNRGWKNAQGELIAFLDGDMLPSPDWLAAYERAFLQQAPDVISGTTYSMRIDQFSSDFATALSRSMGVNPPDLFRNDVLAQFLCLASHALPGQYSSPQFQQVQVQSHAVCREYPNSHIRGCCFVGANVAVAREALNTLGGFAPLLRRGEDLDLGLRMAELGCNFVIAEDAKAYHVDCSTPEEWEWTRLERDAFLYRHPYRSAVMASLCQSTGLDGKKYAASLFPRGMLDIAASEPDLSCSTWAALLYRVPPDLIPGSFDYSETAIVKHFSDAVGVDKSTVTSYLSAAVREGLIIRRSPVNVYFDLHHTTNWLRTKSRYHEHWLRNASFGRNHLTPRQSGQYDANPVRIRCRARYAIEVDLTSNIPWDLVALNMSIPVEHSCQKEVHLRRLSPAGLEAYLKKDSGLITNIPGSLWLHDGAIICEFECEVSEDILPPEIAAPEYSANNAGSIESEHLRFSFPNGYLEKARSLLDYILEGQQTDPEADVRRIYRWLVENLSYANVVLPDYSVLDTGMGTCVHLTRLLANLTRLRGVPVREQCGALMTRSTSPSETTTITTGHSPFGHTWMEVYFEKKGWRPVDLIIMGYGEWQLTPFNVGPEIRNEMASKAPHLFDYYFGSIDPYRIYTHHYANKVNPITILAPRKNRQLLRELLTCVRHTLTCSITPTT